MRVTALMLVLLLFSAAWAAEIPSPNQFFRVTLGADRTLVDQHQIDNYFEALAMASPRIKLFDLGRSTLGNKILMAAISSPENIRNLDRQRAIAKKLANPRGLGVKEMDRLIAEGKAIILVTANIHASEIGANQMFPEWAHDLVTTQDPKLLAQLDQVVLLLVSSLNPDGQLMEVDWYRRQLGTPFEGGRMPWIYHVYAGHDNNRDWYMLTQKETRAVNQEWFPQVWMDQHQMGSAGPRIFVPPYANPSPPLVHPLIWRTADYFGSLMSFRMEQQEKSGVSYGAFFDTYWPGATEGTGVWKNIVGLLTEVASCRLATPVQIESGELSGGGKGLAEYRTQMNFPNPWKGGSWGLRDIIDYQRSAADALLEGAARMREDLLRNRARMALSAVAQGDPATGYRIPASPSEQRDPLAAARLAFLLQENGAEVQLDPVGGAYWIPTAQPLGRFVQEMLEKQRYPEIRPTPGAPIYKPYDMTGWSLPLLMAAKVERAGMDEALRGRLRPLVEADQRLGGLSDRLRSMPSPRPAARRPNLSIA